MYHYTAIQWLFFFYFYCFFGWCFESTYVSLKSRKLVNRGFCRGPFLPLYGSGAIMMLVVSMPFQDNLVLVYIAGCILCPGGRSANASCPGSTAAPTLMDGMQIVSAEINAGGVCGGGSLFPGTDYGAKKAAGYMKLTYLRIEP